MDADSNNQPNGTATSRVEISKISGSGGAIALNVKEGEE